MYDILIFVLYFVTKLTTSLVANANISAQETLFLHCGLLSTAALAFTTVSNPSPASERLSGCSFSAFPLVDASSTEASQPYTILNQKLLQIYSYYHIINKILAVP